MSRVSSSYEYTTVVSIGQLSDVQHGIGRKEGYVVKLNMLLHKPN